MTSKLEAPVAITGRLGIRRRRDEMAHLLEAVGALARAALGQEDSLPAVALRDPSDLEDRLDLALGAEGCDLDEVLARLGEILTATPSSSSPRFVNQLFGGRVPAAVAAEMLVPVHNTSMYTLKAAGALVLVEREVLGRMLAAVGFENGEATMTPGGSLANLVAMVLARHRAAPEVRDAGMGQRRLALYTSQESHYSVRKAAGLLGIGRDSVRMVSTDEAGRMDVERLREQVRDDFGRGWTPFLVAATAGTTVRGAFDPIRDIAGVCRDHGLWLHVDGALGGSFALSPEHRHLLDGSDLADSFAWDAHKMLGVPLSASALLVADRGQLAACLDETADYLYQSDRDDLNPGHRSIQCGRRNDALKIWAAWRHLGDVGWARRLERQMDLARRAAELIRQDPDLTLLEPPPSVNVCFTVRGCPSDVVCDRLDRLGRLKIGHGMVRGVRAIRLVCVNPDLEEADLRRVLDEVKSVAAQPAADV